MSDTESGASGNEQQVEGSNMAGQRRRTRPHAQECTPEFLAGDVILFASTGDLFSNVGRWMMRGEHEAPTYAVHTAQFLDPRKVLEMDATARITTIDYVLTRRYWHGPFRALLPPSAWAWLDEKFGSRYFQGLWKPRGFEVWRCHALSTDQRMALTHAALKYLNVRFGYLKFSAHALDDAICKLLRRNVFLFRHIDPLDRHPVCSGITASVYDTVLNYRFGVDPECADPDQIYDWVHAHPDEWLLVFRLEEDPQVRNARRSRGRTEIQEV
jgi:hypothetical protein